MRSTLALLLALVRPSTSQVLVLGAHHTGTSIASRALAGFGFDLGDDLLIDEANPLKFWESRAVVELNQQRLAAGTPPPSGHGHAAAAAALPSFVGYGFEASRGAPLNTSDAARAIVSKLAASRRPWATKDPRLSLVAAEWLPLIGNHAACVLTVRRLAPRSPRCQEPCTLGHTGYTLGSPRMHARP